MSCDELNDNLKVMRMELRGSLALSPTIQMVKQNSPMLTAGHMREVGPADVVRVNNHIDTMTQNELWAIFLYAQTCFYPVHVDRGGPGDYVIWVRFAGMRIAESTCAQWV
jgi:hypothetical protein